MHQGKSKLFSITTGYGEKVNLTQKLIQNRDFPGGAVVKNPPANAGDMGSSPGPGISHMLRSS